MPAPPTGPVHDVLARLAGGPADALSGPMDGAPSPAWTARHVGERAARTVEELVAELQASADDDGASLDGNDRPGLVWNLEVRHADLHEALGKAAFAEHYWRPVLDAIAPGPLGEHADAVAGVPDDELLRALFARRSRAQMAVRGTGPTRRRPPIN